MLGRCKKCILLRLCAVFFEFVQIPGGGGARENVVQVKFGMAKFGNQIVPHFAMVFKDRSHLLRCCGGAEFRSLGPEASIRIEKKFLEDIMFQF